MRELAGRTSVSKWQRPASPLPLTCSPTSPPPNSLQDVIQTGVSAADRTMKAQLVGELRTMLTHKVGGGWGLGWLWSEWVVGVGRERGPSWWESAF